MEYPKITLKAARVNAGLSQKEAADMLNISKETLSNYEKGTYSPSWDMVHRIGELYRFPVDFIFFGKDLRLKRITWFLLFILQSSIANQLYNKQDFAEQQKTAWGGEKMGGKMIGNYANDGTLYISATNIQEFKCLINKAKKQADELQDTINQLEFFNFHFKFATDE